MADSRTFRILIVGSLMIAIVLAIAQSAFLLWPLWREHCAVRALMDSLPDEQDTRFDEAIVVMKNFDDGRAAIEPLIKAFKSENGGVHWRARSALLEIGATQPLIKTLEDTAQDVEIRRGAAWTLGWMRDKTAIPSLVAALDDDQRPVRTYATWALAQLGPESKVAVPRLRELACDESDQQRSFVAFAFSMLGADAREAVPELIELLGDSETATRSLAANAVKRIGPEAKAAAPQLIALLSDADYEARSTAVEALGEIGPDAVSAVPAIIEALKQETIRVYAPPTLMDSMKKAAILTEFAEALKKIDPEAAVKAGVK